MHTSLWRHPLTLSIYAPTLLISFGRGLLVPILPLYARSFESSYSLVGLALASQSLGMLLGDVPAGLIEGRLGRRRSMLIGLSVIALTSLAMSWAQSIWELLLYGLVAGVGNALWNIARHAYLSDAASVERRGRAIALFGGLARAGSFVGPLVGGTLGALFGLRVVFVAYAVVTLLTLIFPLLFARESGATAHKRGGVRGHARHFGALLKTHYRVLLTAGAGQLLGQMVRAGREIVIPLYAADVLGLDVQSIGVIISAGYFLDAAMFYPAGMVMDRLGRKFAYVPSFVILALGMALVPLTGSFGALLLVACVIGLGNGLGSGTMMTLGADLAPRQAVGEFLGLWRLIGDVGSSGGPIVIGAVASALGLTPAIFVIAAVGVAGAALLGWLVPETLRG